MTSRRKVERVSDPEPLQSSHPRQILVSRTFDVPRDLVFRAWTDPRQIERWWGPKSYQGVNCEVDLRVNGRFRLDLRGPDGSLYPCEGIIRELTAPEKIVYSGSVDHRHPCGAGIPPRSIVTVTFVENSGRTTLTIHTELESNDDCLATTNAGYFPGWSSSLERLDEWLVQNSTSR